MYVLLCVTLSLAVLLTIEIAASALATLVWIALSSRMEAWSPRFRARFLFLLRIAPGIGGVMVVATFVVPAYLVYEPRHTEEIVAVELGMMALVCLCGILLAMGRGLRSYLSTRRLERRWRLRAEPVVLTDASIPAFRLPLRFPILALVGVFRPRLFIADQVYHLLNAGEISAAIAHERGHLAARDTIKRWMLEAFRGMLTILPVGRRIDRAWMESAEAAADEYAARGNATAALDLASAMVKIAGLMPQGTWPEMIAGTSLIAEDHHGIASRILRLTSLAEEPAENHRHSTCLRRLAAGAGASGLCFALLMGIFHPALQARIHYALEFVVSILQ